MSLWSFCSSIPARPERQGYFNSIVTAGLVEGSILATTSVHDRAIRAFYPLGAEARRQIDFVPGRLPVYGGIGTFGVRGPGLEITDEALRPVEDNYDFRPRITYDVLRDNDRDTVVA